MSHKWSEIKTKIVCTCGHDYMYHGRIFNKKLQTFEFSHKGACAECDCPAFKKATGKK